MDLGGKTVISSIDEILASLVDKWGAVDSVKMNELKLLIQKGTYSKKEISYICKKISKMGITEEFEAVTKTINFGNYLRKILGKPPVDMIKAHAHHILFKTGNGSEQQALVKEGQAILRSYGIDPIVGPENLVWAPNGVEGQHDKVALKRIVDGLRKIYECGGEYEDVVEFLEDMAQIAKKR